MAQGAGVCGNPVSPDPCARAAPSPFRGQGSGETRFPHPPRRGRMFTSAVHAAAPHNAAMNIRLFLGGLRPPKPSRGWGNEETRFPHSPAGRGNEETRFPHPPRRGRMFTSGPFRGAHHTRCNRPGSAGGAPASWLRGQGDRPLPDPPPLGAGTGRLHPSGGGREGGGTLRTVNLLR